MTDFLARIDEALRPQVMIAATLNSDQADLTKIESGGVHSSLLRGGTLPLAAEATRVALSQEGFTSDLVTLSVSTRDWFGLALQDGTIDSMTPPVPSSSGR